METTAIMSVHPSAGTCTQRGCQAPDTCPFLFTGLELGLVIRSSSRKNETFLRGRLISSFAKVHKLLKITVRFIVSI